MRQGRIVLSYRGTLTTVLLTQSLTLTGIKIGEVFLGNKHNIATLAMQRMMIGAVARAYNPGCSMSWLPILVGAQGVGKSMFSRNLVPEAVCSLRLQLLWRH